MVHFDIKTTSGVAFKYPKIKSKVQQQTFPRAVSGGHIVVQ